MRSSLATRVLLAAAAMSLPACASTMTYTFTTSASGMLGAGSAFHDAQVVFTAEGDTANIQNLGFFKQLDVSGFTIQIAGLGTYTSADTSYLYVNARSPAMTYVGLNDQVTDFIINTHSGTLQNYALAGAFGPITSSSDFATPDIDTNAGTLFFTSYDPSTFQAFDGPPGGNAVTPEPCSFALLGTGLLGIAGAFRKRFA